MGFVTVEPYKNDNLEHIVGNSSFAVESSGSEQASPTTEEHVQQLVELVENHTNHEKDTPDSATRSPQPSPNLTPVLEVRETMLPSEREYAESQELQLWNSDNCSKSDDLESSTSDGGIVYMPRTLHFDDGKINCETHIY
jgi:hypothetical protein